MSGFYYTFDDQVGEVGTTTENVGDARFAGFEAAAELDILAMINGGTESPYGQLNLYGNITWLDAEFTAGPNNGFTRLTLRIISSKLEASIGGKTGSRSA